MKEIDIIELLKRVKEGKAPKEIEIKAYKFHYGDDNDVDGLYLDENNKSWLASYCITLDTKIKILDKPIIEELPIITGYEHEENKTLIQKNRDKINEIIKFLNNKENKDE